MANESSGRYVATAKVRMTLSWSGFAKAITMASRFGVRSIGRMGMKMVAIMRATVGKMVSLVRKLSRVLMSLMGPLGLIGGMGGGLVIGAGIGLSIKQFAGFESAMARVSALTQATGTQFKKLEDEAMRLGETTVFSAQEAAEAMGYFAQAGFSVEEIMAAMEPALNLAVAGQLDVATAANIVAKAMRGAGLSASEVKHAVDVMTTAFTTSNTDLVQLGDAFRYVAPVAKSAGFSFEETTAMIQLMSDAGVQGTQAGTSLRKVMTSLASPSREAAKMMEKLGVSVADADGNTRPMVEIMEQLELGLAGMSDTQRLAALSTIVGDRAVAGFAAALDRGSDELRDYTKALDDSAGSASRIAATMQDTVLGQFKAFQSAVSGAAIRLGKALAPAVRKVLFAMTQLAPVIGKLVRNITPLFDLLSGNLVSGMNALGAFLQANMAQFRIWGANIAEIVGNVKSALGEYFAWLGGLLGVSGGGMANGLVDGLSMVIDTLAALTSDIPETLKIASDYIMFALATGAQLMIAGLRNMFASAWVMVPTILEYAFLNGGNILTSVFEWFLKAMESLWEYASTKMASDIKEALNLNLDPLEIVKQKQLEANLRGKMERGEIDTTSPMELFNKNRAAFAGLMKANVTGGAENGLGKAADGYKASMLGRLQKLQSRRALNRIDPAFTGFFEKVGGAVGSFPDMFDKIPSLIDAFMPEAVAKAAVSATGPSGPDASKAGQMSGTMEYLANMQKGLAKQKQDAADRAVVTTASNTSKDGPIVGAINDVTAAFREGFGATPGFAE